MKLAIALLVFRLVFSLLCFGTAAYYFLTNDDIRGLLWLILAAVVGLG